MSEEKVKKVLTDDEVRKIIFMKKLVEENKVNPKKKKVVVREKKNTDEEESFHLNKPLEEQYDPNDKYYVDDYLRKCEASIFEAETFAETIGQALVVLKPYMRRVVRAVTGSGMFHVTKVNSKKRFCVDAKIDAKGNYGKHGEGNIVLKFYKLHTKLGNAHPKPTQPDCRCEEECVCECKCPKDDCTCEEETKKCRCPKNCKCAKKCKCPDDQPCKCKTEEGCLCPRKCRCPGYYEIRLGPFYFLTDNPEIRSREIICDPYHIDDPKHDPLFFNTFPGFKAKFIYNEDDWEDEEECIEYCTKKCAPLFRHILKVWAKNDVEEYNYYIEWIFHPLRTLLRTNIMLGVIGPMGAGKTMVFEFLRKHVYGDDLMVIVCGLNKITQEFNKLLDGRMIVCIDETANIGDLKGKNKADVEQLKQSITGDKVVSRVMYSDAVMVENHINFCLCSNSHNPVPLVDGQRRVALAGCDDEIQPPEYYTEINEACDQRCGDCLYTLARLIGKRANLKKIPQTVALENCIKESKTQGTLFFEHVFTNGDYAILSDFIHIQDGEVYLKTLEFYSEVYRPWHILTNNGIKMTENTFSKHIKQVKGIENDYKRIGTGGPISCYMITKSLHKKINICFRGEVDTISLGMYIKKMAAKN